MVATNIAKRKDYTVANRLSINILLEKTVYKAIVDICTDILLMLI